MIAGIGIDVVEVERIQKLLEKWGRRVTVRLFTEHEIAQCSSRREAAQCFAARWAAKEALAKAVGHGWCSHFSWTDVEVSNDGAGKPALKISGKTRQLVKNRNVFLSLTHTEAFAAAVVVVEAPAA